MSVFRRMSDVLQQKVNALLEHAEDPAEAMDLAYEKQLEALQQVRRSIADVLTSEKRLEIQEGQLRQSIGKLQDQARQALQQGREDLAKVALTRAASAQGQIGGLSQQIDQMKDQEEKLQVVAQKLQTKVESFRSQKELVKAQYSAAEAQTKIGEAVTGLSDQMADVSLMVDRARDKTERLQARAAAIDELVDTGTLDQIGSGDDLDRQLLSGQAQSSVEDQLAAMKRQLAAPQPTGALPAASEVIRIHGGDQYRVSSDDRSQLDELDRALLAAVDKGDEAAFHSAVQEALDFVRAHGQALGPDDTAKSDLVVPSPDMTLDEARAIVEGTPATTG